MITITGAYNTAKIFTDALESSAEGQIQALLDQPFTAGSRIRMLPDVHAGAACVVGTTMTIGDKVVPNLVGVDIGCGMETVKLTTARVDLPRLDSFIHDHIPAGMTVRQTPHAYADEARLDELVCAKQLNLARGALSLGTLGGGNHFIEIDRDDEGALYVVVHSGSRNLGLQVAQHYQNAAAKALGRSSEIPPMLAYCEGALLADYLHDMEILQAYAALNRRAIADAVLKGGKLKEDFRFSTTHNYIDLAHGILRKGAVSAQAGETLLIPINMRDGALICQGLGNPDWNFSAPHGAGRLMSRSEVKQRFTLSAYKKEMQGVFSTTVNAETLDECPMAYKSMEEILTHIEPTVRVVKQIFPIYNFKAGETSKRKGVNR